MELGLQTLSATQLSSPERQVKPLTSDREVSGQIVHPCPRYTSSAPSHSSRNDWYSRSSTQTEACARRSPAKTPGCPITPGRGAPPREKAGMESREGAQLTRSTCLEPADRQQQTAAAAQRHGEPMPATASGTAACPPLSSAWAPPSY